MKSIKESIFDDDDIVKDAETDRLKYILKDWLWDNCIEDYGITIIDDNTISISKPIRWGTTNIFSKAPKEDIKIDNADVIFLPMYSEDIKYCPEINHVNCLRIPEFSVIGPLINKIKNIKVCPIPPGVQHVLFDKFLKSTKIEVLYFNPILNTKKKYDLNELLIFDKKNIGSIWIQDDFPGIDFHPDKEKIPSLPTIEFFNKYFSRPNSPDLYIYKTNSLIDRVYKLKKYAYKVIKNPQGGYKFVKTFLFK